MSKGFGSTRSNRANGSTASNSSFKSGTKFSDFEGSFSAGGGYFTLSTPNGTTIEITTENGYNSEIGQDGVTLNASIRNINKRDSREGIYTGFVEHKGFRQSGGAMDYSGSENAVRTTINNMMPYIINYANRYIDRNK